MRLFVHINCGLREDQWGDHLELGMTAMLDQSPSSTTKNQRRALTRLAALERAHICGVHKP